MSNDQIIDEQWVNMKEAAALLGISYDKLSRLVRRNAVRTQPDILDQRAKLVEINELKRVFKVK